MILYRFTDRIYADDLNGKGAAKNGARWNSPGTRVVYCCAAEASTLLEVLAHAEEVPENHVLVIMDIPDDVTIADPKALPSTWKALDYHTATQTVGDTFVNDGKALLLRVPSAITTTDQNYLLNPDHPDAKRVTWKIVDPYDFDPRLFKKAKPKAKKKPKKKAKPKK